VITKGKQFLLLVRHPPITPITVKSGKSLVGCRGKEKNRHKIEIYFVGVGVAHFLYVLYVFVMCLVCPMLLVSPDCPFDLLYYLLNLHIIIKFHHIFYFWSIAVFVYLEPKRMGLKEKNRHKIEISKFILEPRMEIQLYWEWI
jgi:hypothetical protein